jgi:acyl carrier protein
MRTESEVGLHIAEICSIIIGADIDPETDLFTYGMNSLALVRLVGAIERGYGVRLTTLDIHDHPSAAEITALLAGRGPLDADE